VPATTVSTPVGDAFSPGNEPCGADGQLLLGVVGDDLQVQLTDANGAPVLPEQAAPQAPWTLRVALQEAVCGGCRPVVAVGEVPASGLATVPFVAGLPTRPGIWRARFEARDALGAVKHRQDELAWIDADPFSADAEAMSSGLPTWAALRSAMHDWAAANSWMQSSEHAPRSVAEAVVSTLERWNGLLPPNPNFSSSRVPARLRRLLTDGAVERLTEASALNFARTHVALTGETQALFRDRYQAYAREAEKRKAAWDVAARQLKTQMSVMWAPWATVR